MDSHRGFLHPGIRPKDEPGVGFEARRLNKIGLHPTNAVEFNPISSCPEKCPLSIGRVREQIPRPCLVLTTSQE